jgi:hypothetical protein
VNVDAWRRHAIRLPPNTNSLLFTTFVRTRRILMRRLVALFALIATLIGVALPARALTPAHIWSKGIGGTSTDAVNAIAMDASGNLYIAGSFSTTVDFGNGGLVSAGGTDIFVAKV